ncbi:MAG: hypothetical protein KAR54_00550 [Candidatus Pacebacteria bacterium]|nr:hypothetical protein [Candidatus Paceibacterota bacterium]
MKDNIITKAIEAGGNLKVRSALNPILWLCAIVTIPALSGVLFFEATPNWLIILIFVPVITAIIGFLFLLLFDRDKLQSEDYQIKKRSLEIIEQKGDAAPMLIEPGSLDIIPKPETDILLTGDQS